MKKLIYFLVGWLFGLWVLNYFIFDMMFKFIKDQNAVAIMCVMLVSLFTVVWGVLAGKQ